MEGAGLHSNTGSDVLYMHYLLFSQDGHDIFSWLLNVKPLDHLL